MNLANFTFDVDADGIGLLTWDTPGRSMNLINADFIRELESVIEEIGSEEKIKGCVIVSGKDSFSGGADLTMLEDMGRRMEDLARLKGVEHAMQEFFDESRRLSQLYRRLETCGKPFAAAVHGLCLGGGFELALACHFRVLSDAQSTKVGLPEIKIGLFPGAGGTQRVARLMPTADALQMLFKGEQIGAATAGRIGLAHVVVPRADLVGKAKEWIRSGGSPVAPWDKKDFRPPSGRVFSPTGMMVWPAANAIYRRETQDNYPAAKAILHAVYEGLQLPIDLALKVESRWFTKILRSKEAHAMIRTLFVSLSELNKGARRPKSASAADIGKIGVIGAGFMGAGIAYVSASAGLSVVLIDRDLAAAEKGKQVSHKLISDRIARGRARSSERDALLSRIETSADYGRLADCDLVIEAVFEDRSVKADTIKRAEAVLPASTVFASNTSTLPISSLAQYSARPERFIGIHFFSPVEKMPLVEVIAGKYTHESAVAAAFDFVRALKKTPILVSDGRGFFANRCVGAYLLEGHLMVMEGVPPAMIENVAKMAGMPIGPLALTDEVAIDLAWRILTATEGDLGADAVDPRQRALLDIMVNRHGRSGRKNRKGFYDYPEKGAKRLWPGLGDIPSRRLEPDSIDVEELRLRFLAAQALEASRTVQERVISDPREADVGSILGFGFAPFTGGVLSYIDGIGAGAFVLLCSDLEKRHGRRFAPNDLLLEMADSRQTFYSGLQKIGARA
ncbi:MAG TPA: 3-hydroxyacyl-CoA dehydrogenase NAD-binding domain-containing protein [Beijerinckiaceae bacterium]|nr:3-hydroxyacyl-CoA dehydrogenase NAD-binding domain-containing protein [Beijerinckiaceae bacterium]